MIKKTSTALYALLLALVMTASLGACSSTEEPDKPAVSSQETSQSNEMAGTQTPGVMATVPPATDAQPVQSPDITTDHPRGGRLVLLFDDPPTLDPHLATDNISGAYVQEVFNGLVTISPDIQIKPDLAENWDVSADGLKYTFNLHPDGKFHDGRRVTAEDFRWSLERATDPALESPVSETYLNDIVGVSAKLSGEAQSVSGINVVDDSTLELTIDAPKAYFLAKLTYPTGFVVDPANVQADPKEWVFEPNAAGPFTLDQYDVGELMVLGRNDNYHLGPPFVDAVELNLAGGEALLMYENDEIHLTGVGLATLERLADPSEPLNAELVTAPSSFSTSYYGMNVTQAPFDDLKFRQAMNYAINKEEIAEVVAQGLIQPAKGILPPRFPGYNPDLKGYEFDPEKAKQLLAESKYADPDSRPPIILSIPGSFGATVGPSTQAILKAWEVNLGVEVEIEHTEWATFLQDLNQQRYQMFQVGWGADYPDPENFLDILFHGESENNHTVYNNPEVNSLLEQARVEPDQVKRFELYNTIEQKIVDDAPWVPLWHSRERKVLIKPEVKDYFLVPMTIPKWRYVYFESS